MAPSPSPKRTRHRVAAAGLTRLAVIVIAATVGLTAVATARADGDPASDVLYTQYVFLPFEAPIPKEVASRLDQTVQSSRSAGYTIKVAIIGAPADLGTAYVLWRKPQRYARFLGQELVYLYKGPLLIVMPNAFGFFHYKHGVTAERKLLAKLRVAGGQDSVGLVNSAVTAVAKLAAASGHPVPVPPPANVESPSGGGSQLMDRIIIGIAAAAFIVLVVVVPTLYRRRARATQ